MGHPRTRRQINSLLFEPVALSRDKAGVIALAHKGHEITRPSDLVKDPMVVEFTDSVRTSDSASPTWNASPARQTAGLGNIPWRW